MRDVRTTWTAGGVGLIVCGVIGMLAQSMLGGPIVPWLEVVIAAIYGSAVLVFAVGLSREASVVARRPLGVTALAVVAVWPFVPMIVQSFLPWAAGAFVSDMAAYRELQGVLTTVLSVDLLVSVAAALVAAVQIGRAGTVPRPWCWAPLWALGVGIVAGVLPLPLFAIAGPQNAQTLVGLASAVGSLGFLAGTLGLGILAVVLAARDRRGSVEVFRST